MVKFNELLGNRSIVRIIILLIDSYGEELSQVRIKKATGFSNATLAKWVKKLKDFDIITVRREGVTNYCKLNDNAVVKELKILNTLLKLEKMENIKKKYNARIYLYGSAARGEDTEGSDIDILMVGKARKDSIIREINTLSGQIGKKISIQIFSPQEWAMMDKKDKAFFERIEKDKIEL